MPFGLEKNKAKALLYFLTICLKTENLTENKVFKKNYNQSKNN
jgi:hypothetical protein